MQRKCKTDPRDVKYMQIKNHVNVRERFREFKGAEFGIKQAYNQFQTQAGDNNFQHNAFNCIKEQTKRLFTLNHLLVFFFAVLVVFLFFRLVIDENCMEEYQAKNCYSSSKVGQKQCEDLYRCIKFEEDNNYWQYLVTFVAALFVLIRKYGQNIRFIYNNMVN